MKKWPKNNDNDFLLKRRKNASTTAKLKWLEDAISFTRKIEYSRKKAYPKTS